MSKRARPVEKQRKMSEIMKEMAQRVLRVSETDASDEAFHMALMFANIAWNECVGMGGDREAKRPAWESIGQGNPDVWTEFISRDTNRLIDDLVAHKKKKHRHDRRRIALCGVVNGNVRVEYLEPAAPGVDPAEEVSQMMQSRMKREREAYAELMRKGMDPVAARDMIADVQEEMAQARLLDMKKEGR